MGRETTQPLANITEQGQCEADAGDCEQWSLPNGSEGIAIGEWHTMLHIKNSDRQNAINTKDDAADNNITCLHKTVTQVDDCVRCTISSNVAESGTEKWVPTISVMYHVKYTHCTKITTSYFLFLGMVLVTLRDGLENWFQALVWLQRPDYCPLTGHNPRLLLPFLPDITSWERHLYLTGLSKNPTCRKCVTEEETSVHILYECEALASLRHAHLDYFFLDHEDIINISPGAIWIFGKGTGLL